MTSVRSADEQSLIIVARAVKTKGLKGELVADLLTDFPERFSKISRLFAIAPDGERKVIELERYTLQKGRLVFKFVSVDSLESASRFVGYQFAVPETERVPLAEDEFYDYELENCTVEQAGEIIGQVVSVMRTGGVSLLVVRRDDKKEVLIPLAEAIVTDIDIEHKRIAIDPPEGLLDL